MRAYRRINDSLTFAFAGGYVVMLLWLALANHRSAEQSVARVWRQAAGIAGALALGVLLVCGFWIVYAMR